MARSLREIQAELQLFDEEYNFYMFDIDDWKRDRKPLVDELEAWHQLPVEDRH
jgi:hypothetical protein